MSVMVAACPETSSKWGRSAGNLDLTENGVEAGSFREGVHLMGKAKQ